MGAIYRDEHSAELTARHGGEHWFADDGTVGLLPITEGRRPRAGTRSVAAQVSIDIALGLIARVVLAVVTAYRTVDAEAFGAWARTLHDHPLGSFHALAPMPMTKGCCTVLASSSSWVGPTWCSSGYWWPWRGG